MPPTSDPTVLPQTTPLAREAPGRTGLRGFAQAHDLRTLLILCVLMAFSSISTDIYLPALPGMGEALHAGTGAMEFTISGYLIGFSLGQFFWGPLSDRVGRRGPIAIGMLLYIAGSIGCAVAQGVEGSRGARCRRSAPAPASRWRAPSSATCTWATGPRR
jgi:DHA1 family bicyclomycin/chloramphenicol resistance-like MFS transporter